MNEQVRFLVQFCIFLIVLGVLLVPTLVMASNQILCMADNLYHEARGEPEAGIFLVGFITMNRVRDSRWPNTVCSTVYQIGQFEWTKRSQKKASGKLYNRMIEIAAIVIQSEDTEHYGFYFNTTHAKSKSKSLLVVGNHRFYE